MTVRTPVRTVLRALRNDDSGISTILLSLSSFALMGAAALAIDVGSLYLAKRRLQGVADSAVTAVVDRNLSAQGAAIAQAVIAANGMPETQIAALELGTYTRDKAIAPANRFQPTAAAPTAARLSLRQSVPLIFGGLITGTNAVTISASAISAKSEMMAFSMGTHLVSVSGLENSILSALAGRTLNLSLNQVQALNDGTVNIIDFADALRRRIGQPTATFGAALAQSTTLQTVVAAMADAAPDQATADALRAAAVTVGDTQIRMSDLIDLGVLGQGDINDGRTKINATAYALLVTTLKQARGEPYDISLGVTVPGLTDVQLRISGGPETVHSPWLTVNSAIGYTLRTARTRILLTTNVASGLAAVATINVPVYLEIAAGSSTVDSVRCDRDPGNQQVGLAVVPSIGSAAIGQPDLSQFSNMSRPMTLTPATLVNVPLLLRINASSNLAVGGVTTQLAYFSRTEIDQHVTKSVATNDAVQGVAQSLVSTVQISATTPLLGTVNAGPVVSAVGGQLRIVAPLIDGVLNSVTSALGVKLGVSDVTVDQLRCGVPLLI